jgi:hypothetical protein
MSNNKRFHFAVKGAHYAAREQERQQKEAIQSAMATLLQAPPSKRLACISGLLISVGSDAPEIQEDCIEASLSAILLEKKLSQRPASGSATGERKPGAVSPDNSGAGRGPSPRPAPVNRQAAGGDQEEKP